MKFAASTQKALRRSLKTGASVSILLLALTACDPKVALRGNAPLESRLEQISVGQSTKRDVVAAIGTPSTIGTFDDNVWYYMSQRRETWAFYPTEVTENQVLAFHFDEGGTLQTIDTYDKDALTEVNLEEKETPTSGRTMSIMEQLFGNLGKFGT
ncbi:outer membrane protein assembly factor BamE [Hwanghaeella sp. LZ110]|uniref:outer membrane protein assembly factor BamE n=1 Tax=Hwanghaeella sp. LZ110 TaxID=3402810 RepID=UPI003B684620